MTNIQPIRNQTLNILKDGKFIGSFCYREDVNQVQLEDDIVEFSEPQIGDPSIFQLVVNRELGFADFLTL